MAEIRVKKCQNTYDKQKKIRSADLLAHRIKKSLYSVAAILLLCVALLIAVCLGGCNFYDGNENNNGTTSDIISDGGDTTASVPAGKYARVGFIYRVDNGWRLTIRSAEPGSIPTAVAAAGENINFSGWRGYIDENISAPTSGVNALPSEIASSLLTDVDTEINEDGTYSELWKNTGSCAAVYVAEYKDEIRIINVKIYNYDGTVFGEYGIEAGKPISAELLNKVPLPKQTEGVFVRNGGWTVTAEGHSPVDIDLNSPGNEYIVNVDGTAFTPKIIASYRVTVNTNTAAGAGNGSVQTYQVDAGSNVSVESLTGSLTARTEDAEAVYTCTGFTVTSGGKSYVIGLRDTFCVDGVTDVTAIYARQEKTYTVEVETPVGVIPDGDGKKFEYTGNYSGAKAVLEKYRGMTYEKVRDEDGDKEYRYIGLDEILNGTSWRLVLKWQASDAVVTLTFRIPSGTDLRQPEKYTEIIYTGAYGSEMVMPEPPTLEDSVRSYDFLGWKGEDGNLLSVGDTIAAENDMTFTATLTEGEFRTYTVVFRTPWGSFGEGKDRIEVTGRWGDELKVPEPPIPDSLVYGEGADAIIFTFVGWDHTPGDTVNGNDEYIAVLDTDDEIYALEYYVNGELYRREPHRSGDVLVSPAAPEGAEGKLFSGWRGLPPVMPSDNVEVTCTVRAVKVSYRLDGKLISETEIAIGSLVIPMPVPAEPGLTISGWTTTDVTDIRPEGFIMPDHDVIFDAVSSPRTYKISYFINGELIYEDTAEFESTVILRGIEVREGYSFSGWLPGTDGSSSVNPTVIGGSFVMPASDVVFVGSFELCRYSVNYYVDGILFKTEEYGFGEAVTILPDEEQEGCTFLWSCPTVDISSGSFIMPAGDVDIYGSFTAGDLCVVYYVDGVVFARIDVTRGSVVTLIDPPQSEGYIFSGWTCVECDISEGSFIMPGQNVTILGNFYPRTHTVWFLEVPGGEVLASGEVEYGSEFSLGDMEFCREGFVSVGWVLLSGDALNTDRGYLMPDSDVYFFAEWRPCMTIGRDGEWLPCLEGDNTEDGYIYDVENKVLYLIDTSLEVAGVPVDVTVKLGAPESEPAEDDTPEITIDRTN